MGNKNKGKREVKKQPKPKPTKVLTQRDEYQGVPKIGKA
jgi:hypothetical protein